MKKTLFIFTFGQITNDLFDLFTSLSPLPSDKSNTKQLKLVLRISLSPYVALS